MKDALPGHETYSGRLAIPYITPSGGLSSAMGVYKMQFEGKAHRADVDAYNTLRLFFEILKQQKRMLDMISMAKEVK